MSVLSSKIGNAAGFTPKQNYSVVKPLGNSYSPSAMSSPFSGRLSSTLGTKVANAYGAQNAAPQYNQGLSEGVVTGGNQIHAAAGPVSGYSVPFHTQYSPAAQQPQNAMWGKMANVLNQQNAATGPMVPAAYAPQQEANAGTAPQWQRMGSGWLPSQQTAQGSMPGASGGTK